jgi:hypothetical protein
MKLCTFLVETHLGRRARLGAFKAGRIADLNFATAWYMAQSGEPDPQRLADALAPDNLPDYLRAGLRAVHTAEELFLGAGPHPADWWKHDPVPRGPNGETLVYTSPEHQHAAGSGLPEVRLLSPLPEVGCKTVLNPGQDMTWSRDLSIQVAAVGGAYILPGEPRRDIAGFTVMLAGDGHAALCPFLATPDEVKDIGVLEIRLRVNGEMRLTETAAALKRLLQSRDGIAPGEWVSVRLAAPALEPGDSVELEATPTGALKCQLSK